MGFSLPRSSSVREERLSAIVLDFHLSFKAKVEKDEASNQAVRSILLCVSTSILTRRRGWPKNPLSSESINVSKKSRFFRKIGVEGFNQYVSWEEKKMLPNESSRVSSLRSDVPGMCAAQTKSR